MSDFNDILNLISSNQKKANPAAQVNYATNYIYFNPIPPYNFKHPSPPKQQVSDSLLRIYQMQKRLNMSPTAMKASQQPKVAYTYYVSTISAVYPPPVNKFVSPTISKYQSDQAVTSAIVASPQPQPQPELYATEVLYDEPHDLQASRKPKPDTNFAPQNRMAMQYNYVYAQADADLHETDQKSISILYKQLYYTNYEKYQLKAKIDSLEQKLTYATADKDFYQQKCEELYKMVDGQRVYQRIEPTYQLRYVQSQQAQRYTKYTIEESSEHLSYINHFEDTAASVYATYSRFLASQVLYPYPSYSTTALQPNCFKILPPEGTYLREQAAKRHVRIEQNRLTWGRIIDGEVKPSGVAYFSDIIHCLFGYDASIFRSKVLAARRAGYCNPVFELIQSGILDYIYCKNVGGETSVVLFLAEKILIFEFYDNATFDSVCKALVDFGL